MTLVLWALVFGGAAGVITWSGVQLARTGDEIAERAGWSRLLVGMLLVAAATSLPELVTTVSAAVADAPDLAVGDLLGSSMANMAILAVVDLLARHRVWLGVEIGHARVASVAIALTSLAALGILTSEGASIGWVGVDTVLIAAAYVAAVAWMRRSPTGRFAAGGVLPVPTGWSDEAAGVEGAEPGVGAGDGDRLPLRRAAIRFGLASLVVLGAAPVLTWSGHGIAIESGVGETFIGSALLAVATSLPELVASIAAVRIGAHDLAVGNLFGSNTLNVAALVVADLGYTGGPILSAVDPGQVVAAVGAILLMALALTAIVHGTETRVLRLEPDAVLLLLVYLGCLYAVWSVSA